MQKDGTFINSLHKELSEQFLSDLRTEFQADLEWLTRPRPLIPVTRAKATRSGFPDTVLTKVRQEVTRRIRREPPTVEIRIEVIEPEYVVIEKVPSSRPDEVHPQPQPQAEVNYERSNSVRASSTCPNRRSSETDRADYSGRASSGRSSSRATPDSSQRSEVHSDESHSDNARESNPATNAGLEGGDQSVPEQD